MLAVAALLALLALGGVGICVTYVIGVWPSEEANVDWAGRLERIRNVAIILGGIAALGLAYWRGKAADRQASAAHEQVRAAQEQGQLMLRAELNQRYEKGSERLGSSVLSVRLDGIIVLEHLAWEHPERYHVQVMKVLFAFIRQPIAPQDSADSTMLDGGEARQDAQAAVDAVRMCRAKNKALEVNLLRSIDLHGADLRRADLSNLDLSYVPPTDAFTVLRDSTGSGRPRTDISHANLSGADLFLVRIEHGSCASTDFSGADLFGAKLRSTWFFEANFLNANLENADMSGARFTSANLRGAQLGNTNLSDATFWERSPREMGLTQEQLNKACADPSKPPCLKNVVDAETGKALEWGGGACDDSKGS